MKNEKVHAAPKLVEVYKGYAVFLDYEGEVPDSDDIIYTSTVKLAEEVCDKLNDNVKGYKHVFNDRQMFISFYIHGVFKYRTVLVDDDSIFARTLSTAMKVANDSTDGRYGGYSDVVSYRAIV